MSLRLDCTDSGCYIRVDSLDLPCAACGGSVQPVELRAYGPVRLHVAPPEQTGPLLWRYVPLLSVSSQFGEALLGEGETSLEETPQPVANLRGSRLLLKDGMVDSAWAIQDRGAVATIVSRGNMAASVSVCGACAALWVAVVVGGRILDSELSLWLSVAQLSYVFGEQLCSL